MLHIPDLKVDRSALTHGEPLVEDLQARYENSGHLLSDQTSVRSSAHGDAPPSLHFDSDEAPPPPDFSGGRQPPDFSAGRQVQVPMRSRLDGLALFFDADC